MTQDENQVEKVLFPQENKAIKNWSMELEWAMKERREDRERKAPQAVRKGGLAPLSS